MRAIAVKEFRELRRDRRTLAMLFLLPFLFLVVFGYAASFDIKDVPTVVVGRGRAAPSPGPSPATFDVVATDADGDAASAARSRCAAARRSSPWSRRPPATARRAVLIDGTELFAAQAALRSLAELAARANGAGSGGQSPLGGASPHAVQVDVLYNPDLRTAVIMIPGLCGIILVFVGTIATALGRRTRAAERHHGAARRDAVPAARRLPRQDRPVPAHRRRRHGHRRGGRHAAVRRPLPRVGRDLRARRAAVPLRHARDRASSSRASRRPRRRPSSWR